MGNNQVYKFKDLSITSAQLPKNMHSIIEASDDDLYLVDSVDNSKIYKSTDKGNNWGLITDRANDINAICYRRDDEQIFFAENTTTAILYYFNLYDDTVLMWSLTYAGSVWYDVIITTDNVILGWGFETQAGDLYRTGSSSTAGGTYANLGTVGVLTWDFTPGVFVGEWYYYLFQWSNGNPLLYKQQKPNAGFTHQLAEDCGANLLIPPSFNQKGIAYDGDDTLYFILQDTGDSKYYLYSYAISSDTLTKLSEYNLCIMLDRNCSNSAPNEYEKAFDVARDGNNLSRIWEIKPKKGGLIQLQTINKNANIIAITDNFIMFGGGEMYEYTDILADNTVAEGVLNAGIFPIPTKAWFNCHPDDAILFYNNDTLKVYDDTDELILFAKITDKSRNENGIYEFGLDAYSNELWRRSYVKSHSADKTSDKLKDNVDNNCSFCHRDSSIYSGDATNYSYSQDRPPMAMFDYARFMERIVGSASPNGLVRTELYSALTKAPQYYPGTYNFRDEVIGTTGSFIGFVDTDNSGGSTVVEIITSEDGHKKVLKLTANIGGDNVDMWHSLEAATVSGFYEFSIKIQIASDNCYLYGYSGGTLAIRARINGDKLQVYHTAAWNDIGNILDDTWYDLRFVYNCTTDTYDVWIDSVEVDTGIAFASVVDNLTQIRIYYTQDATRSIYIDAFGDSEDPNYNVGDNLVAWDVEINGNIELIDIGQNPSYYPKKLGITRATCVGAAGISQTYSDASLEDGKAIILLKEYRDLKIQATTEALQVATALFNLFSQETKFIGLRVVNQEYIRCGNTVNFANTGDVTVAEGDYLVLYYEYDWVNDVYDLMVLTDNILLLREMESYFDRGAVMVHQNSTAVNQNQVAINTKPTFYTDAGDPTVNDDLDLGYEKGDLWLNTTDKGLFVCCDNADGAADWDEITKA